MPARLKRASWFLAALLVLCLALVMVLAIPPLLPGEIPFPPSTDFCQPGDPEAVREVTIEALTAGSARFSCHGHTVRVKGFVVMEGSEMMWIFRSRQIAEGRFRQWELWPSPPVDPTSAASVSIVVPQGKRERFNLHNVTVVGVFRLGIGRRGAWGQIEKVYLIEHQSMSELALPPPVPLLPPPYARPPQDVTPW